MTTKKGPKEILLVEDSPTQAEQTKYILERHGYQVATAQNGREAMNLLAAWKPNLVISDILMPEVDGYQLCRFIREERHLQDTPIILLTALSEPIDVMRALECGADNFIIKPFEENHLLKWVKLFLLEKGLQQQEEAQKGLEFLFQGQKYFITSDRLQILNLLLSTYEAAVEKNTELIKAQKELKEQAQILAGINRVFHEAMTCETEEELGRTCLAAAEDLTGSKFGFIAEINREGLLDDIAVSDPGWAACRLPGTVKPIIAKGFHIRGIFGRTVKEEKAIIINDPLTDPDRVGTPEGHPPIEAFLGVPLKHADKTIGLIGLGNKPGGYDLRDQIAAEALAPAIVESFLRKRAEARIKELNADLLSHVRQLEAANKEMEAFSYSVSHDLRSPLRGITGFARMLQEDYGEKLDAKGLHYLEMIEKASIHMNELIDALLGLSRVTQAEMQQQTVDLSALARSIAENLQSSEPARQVDFIIAEGLVATGDPRLMKVVLENLLNNAWKFTGETPKARIELGVQDSDRGQVFFVRDNGVGFDMKYADKLFGAFKRLHGANEFPGTGIGLATVLRIINRHGGRIWAESAVDQGAAFYFTLNT